MFAPWYENTRFYTFWHNQAVIFISAFINTISEPLVRTNLNQSDKLDE